MKHIIISEGVLTHNLTVLCRSAEEVSLYIHGDSVTHAKHQVLFWGRWKLGRLIRLLGEEVGLTVTSPEPLHNAEIMKAVDRCRTMQISLPDGSSSFDGWLLAKQCIPRHLAIQEERQMTAIALVTEQEKAFYEAASIQCLTPSEYEVLGHPLDSGLRLASSFTRGSTWEMITFLILLLLGGLCVLPWLAEKYLIPPLAAAIQHAWTIAVDYLPFWVALFGAGLYWLRNHERVIYGCVECFAGGLLAFYASNQFMESSTIELHKILAVLAALYVVVRGLDNIGKGLSHAKAKQVWRRIFGDGC